jgi:coenzyme F420-reducing hydrogenase delta subunit/Pyruvate/2-oxoacid:ferredoxin oxidoreductase delta subunit
VEVIAPAEITRFEGSPGRFHVRFSLDATHIEREVGAVVVATDCELEEGFLSWGLEESKRVCSLSVLERHLGSEREDFISREDGSSTYVFLCGITHPSYPASQERAIQTARKVASEPGNRVIFLSDDLKVAGPGLERLTLRAREAGVLFVKVTGARPQINGQGDDIVLSYYDDAMGQGVTVRPDLLVLEEAYRPPEGTARLAGILGVRLDSYGFFQGDQVYNQPIFTNRAGVWVVGSAKGPVSGEEGVAESKAAALEVFKLLAKGEQWIVEDRLKLDRKKCAICLTCYRVCPHRAISHLNRRPVFSDLACTGCGICTEECPMEAIQLSGFGRENLRSQIFDSIAASGGGQAKQSFQIVAFCCQNSAFEAANLASLNKVSLPSGTKLIQVPCAGKVDAGCLLNAFRAGADGVMVLACHHDSCRSVEGSRVAECRVEDTKRMIREAGMEKERLVFGTLAPTLALDFARMVREMEQTLRVLGESPIGASRRRQLSEIEGDQ